MRPILPRTEGFLRRVRERAEEQRRRHREDRLRREREERGETSGG
ncbi:hypothetical protein [Nocardioides marmoraquaticus]